MSSLISVVSVVGRSLSCFIGVDCADPMSSRDERQGQEHKYFLFSRGLTAGTPLTCALKLLENDQTRGNSSPYIQVQYASVSPSGENRHMNKLFCGLLASLFVAVGAKAQTVEGDTRITGTYAQGGMSIPLEITRITVFQETKKKTPKPSDIDGAWIGGASRLRFVLHIITYEDGMTAEHDSPDQNAFGIPVTTITRGGALLKFEIKPTRGSFEGNINPEKTTISGTWKQGGSSMPLVLKRTNEFPRPGDAVVEHKEVFVPMRDGVRLALDLYFPSGPSSGLPVI